MGDNRLTLGGRSLDPSFLRMQESRGTTGRPADDTAFPRMPQQVRHDGKEDSSFLRRQESSDTPCLAGTPCNDGHDDPAQHRRATPLEQAAYQLLSQRGRLQFDARRFLSQSSFNLSLSDSGRDAGEAVETVRAAPEPAGRWSLWGRGAMTRFNGVDEGVRMDGDVLYRPGRYGLRQGPLAGRRGAGLARRGTGRTRLPAAAAPWTARSSR